MTRSSFNYDDRLDPGDLNVLIRKLIGFFEGLQKIILLDKGELRFPGTGRELPILYYTFKKNFEKEAGALKATENQRPIIFAYTAKDSSTKEDTPHALYSLEVIFPTIQTIAKEYKAKLFIPLALCQNVAKIPLSLTKMSHMVLLEIDGLENTVILRDPVGSLSSISSSDSLKIILQKIAMQFYPDKLAESSAFKDQKYEGWRNVGAQIYSDMCVYFVHAWLASIMIHGNTDYLSFVKLTPELVRSKDYYLKNWPKLVTHDVGAKVLSSVDPSDRTWINIESNGREGLSSCLVDSESKTNKRNVGDTASPAGLFSSRSKGAPEEKLSLAKLEAFSPNFKPA